MSDPGGWLDPERAAAFISVRPDALPRLVRQGRIPAPSYHLGPRSPRWDRAALDAAFRGGTASTDAGVAVHALIEQIEAEGRACRQANAGRRDR